MSVFEFDIMFVCKNISANYELYIIQSVTYILTITGDGFHVQRICRRKAVKTWKRDVLYF